MNKILSPLYLFLFVGLDCICVIVLPLPPCACDITEGTVHALENPRYDVANKVIIDSPIPGHKNTTKFNPAPNYIFDAVYD